MLITHPSHFGLEKIAETETSVVLTGSLANCKRIAAAHGMEVDSYEGCLVSCDGSHAVYAPVDESKPNRIWYKNGGLIQRGRDDYSVVIPRNVWDN